MALGIVGIVLISWSIALFEYVFQVPANRIGFKENGGPFSLFELKIILTMKTPVQQELHYLHKMLSLPE